MAMPRNALLVHAAYGYDVQPNGTQPVINCTYCRNIIRHIGTVTNTDIDTDETVHTRQTVLYYMTRVTIFNRRRFNACNTTCGRRIVYLRYQLYVQLSGLCSEMPRSRDRVTTLSEEMLDNIERAAVVTLCHLALRY